MDALTIRALQRAGHQGLPADAGAVLLIELEGLDEGMAELAEVVDGTCREHNARDVHGATTAEERTNLWKARKGALGALGQLAPNYYLQDGVIPRTLLPEVLQAVQVASEKYDLPIANVAHAGDGNLHPCIVFDERIPGQTEKVIAAGADILWKCVQVGGTLSGEHGVGLEKQAYMSWLFGPADFHGHAPAEAGLRPGRTPQPGQGLPHGGADGRSRSVGAARGRRHRRASGPGRPGAAGSGSDGGPRRGHDLDGEVAGASAGDRAGCSAVSHRK